jgi:formylglycine-generating enzyme required for sulfatase activity
MNELDYCTVRDHTERLAFPLSPEDQTVQTMPDVSPTKWHRAHTTWFFETFVLGDDPTFRPYDPAFSYLFNSYYEAVGARYPRPQRGLLSRPGASEIGRYRRAVDQAMAQLLASDRGEKLAGLIRLGLHHEQQHQELLLMDAKHVLGTNPLAPVYQPATDDPDSRPAETGSTSSRPAGRGEAEGAGSNGDSDALTSAVNLADLTGPRTDPPRSGWLEADRGIVEIGHDQTGFAFDNESPRHEVLLGPHAIALGLATCGEWLAFMDDGGYQRPELWMSDGWLAVLNEGWQAPLYWQQAEDSSAWEVFTLHGRRPVRAEEPVVHVSWYEADAFARWRACRLPSEAEWETAAPPPPAQEGLLNGGLLQPSAAGASRDARWWIDAGTGSGTGWYGQVWQWTESPYCAYPGFKPAAGAVGEYNGKFMVNQMSLRGSACVTSPGHARRTYRNFFPPAARWAYSGVRLARDET